MPLQNSDDFYLIEVFTVALPLSDYPGLLLYGAAWRDEGAYVENYDAMFPFEEEVIIQISEMGPRTEGATPHSEMKVKYSIHRVARKDFKPFESGLLGGFLDFSLLGLPTVDLPRVNGIARPEVIQLDKNSEWSRRVVSPAPESRCRQRLSRVTTFWPLSSKRHKQPDRLRDFLRVLSDSAAGVKSILAMAELLEQRTGLSFSDAYSQRIGTFEVYRFDASLAEEQFSILYESSTVGERKTVTGVSISRASDLRREHHIAHVVLRNVHDITLSQIVHLPKGVSSSREVHSAERLSESSVTIYSRDGRRMLFHEHMHALRGVGLEMMLVHGSARISDKFSSEKLANNVGLRERLESVAYGVKSRSEVLNSLADPWYPLANEMSNIVSRAQGKFSRDRFFARGDAGQVDSIMYIKSLIEESDNVAVMISDPFFDSHALGRVIARVANLTVPLSVMTCLVPQRTDKETPESLRQVIRKNSRLLPGKLRVVSLARGKDQAFHDRYIYLKKGDGRAIVHVLTNSLNKAAGDWPLCMTSLGLPASLEVGYYLENLERGVDVHSANAEVTVELVWPCEEAPGTSPSRRSQDGRRSSSLITMAPAMRWLLKEPPSTPVERLLSIAAEQCLLSKQGPIDPDPGVRRIRGGPYA